MKTFFTMLAAAGLCAAALGQIAPPGAQPRPAEVLATVLAGDQGLTERELLLDRDLLDRLAPSDAFLLDLGQGPLAARVERVERRSERSFSVFASLADDPHARIIVTSVNGAVAGIIRTPLAKTQLQIRTRPDGSHIAVPFESRDFDECRTESGGRRFPTPDAEPLEPVPAEAPADGAGDAARGMNECAAQPTIVFDVLTVYTTVARTEAGGTDQMMAEAQLAIDTTNQAYADSFIGARARLVFAYETGYGETLDMEIDRDNLTDPADGLIDNAHGFRDLYGADFVVLIVGEVGQDGCGIAYCLPSGAAEGFCVVKLSCASSNWSFPHELGHLQGCAHNREDAGSGCNEHCYSYGHRFTGDDGVGYRTIMSYNNDAGDFERIGIFSNPNVFWQGAPCGELWGDCDDDEYNVLTISQTSQNRENWRNPRFNVWVDFNHAGRESGSFNRPWDTMVEGVDAVFDLPAPEYNPPQLWLKPGVSDETLTISKPMTIRSCGVTVIGQQ